MMQPLISIIVPVYNAEKYVAECLKSILDQSFQDYEIIVVNDGSTDNSLQVCETVASIDARVKIYSTENKGVSHARNYGIRHATGQWLMFLDSDDYLVEQCLEPLAGVIDHSTQAIYGDYAKGNVSKNKLEEKKVEANEVMVMMLDSVNNALLPGFYKLKDTSLYSVCGKLFSREIIEQHQIRFDEKLKLSEDMFFNVNYLRKIKHITLSNIPIFIYRENGESVTNNFKEEHLDNRLYLFEQLKRFQLEDEVFVTSTMLILTSQLESGMRGLQRKRLENRIKSFWKSNREILMKVKCKKISVGKWQNKVYKICVRLFLLDLYELAFGVLRFYMKLS